MLTGSTTRQDLTDVAIDVCQRDSIDLNMEPFISALATTHLDHRIQRSLLLLLISCLTITTTIVHAYNLDTDKALLKHGPKGSYFGYSIAQHATYEQQNINSTFKPFILVGAPRADSTRTPLLSGVKRPGAIYKCDLSLSQACAALDIDSTISSTLDTNIRATSSGNKPTPTGQLLPSNMDLIPDRTDQWLGVSVKSQGPNGYAMACAHRRVLKGPDVRWGQGICYSLTQNLTLHKTWQPCANRPVNMGHEEYGFCQVGTSCDISESSELSVGAPGTYTWRGTAFTNNIRFSAKDDRTWYMAPVKDDEAKVDKHSYLGMSIVSGKFFNDKMYYASGAPRSKDVGQVLIMTKPMGKGESNFKVEQILDGEQMASSFGYNLAKIDFNGDGRPDLVVAAPFYYNQSDGGRVYLFTNNGKTFVPSGQLTGKLESKFGLALANCGDLNHDKYEDLAVGAPFDPFGGSVYIYLGSQSGLRMTPSQIIKASVVGNNLQTFGYSLSGGLDLDRNGYPDLAVGSYADDSIYLLRARPIIDIVTKIEGNLTKIDPNRTACDGEKTFNSLPCFQFATCFELDPAKIREYTNAVKLHYRIEAETFAGQKYSRVKFRDGDKETPHIKDRIVNIQDFTKVSKNCYAQRVDIKDRTDIQTPINFKLTFYLVPTYNQKSSAQLRTPTISSSSSTTSLSPIIPVLNQDEAERVFSARFLKDCGANDICESHLDVDGSLAMPNETLGINEPGYPSDKQINVTIRASNNAEPAYEAKLFLTHPANLIYSGFKASKQVRVVECSSVEKNLIKCDLGNPMTKGTTKLLMIFNTQNQAGTFNFNLSVNTTSQNSKDAKSSYDLGGTIRKKTEVQIPTRAPPVYPETPMQEPPAWLIMASILLGILLFIALFYCLYVNGFFERSKATYTQAATEDRFH